MDYKDIKYLEDKVILEGVKNFNIKQILECGQCFRWDKVGEMNYIIVAFGKVLEILQEEDKVTFNASCRVLPVSKERVKISKKFNASVSKVI